MSDSPEGVSPLKDEPWYESQVLTVMRGERLLGATMVSKLSQDQLDTLGSLARSGQLCVERTEHGSLVEIAWASDWDTLATYWRLQEQAQNELPLVGYWWATGKLFGYRAEDIVSFVGWISQDPCPCPCPQCRPDLF